MSNSGYNLKNRNRQKTPFMQPLCFVQIFKYFPTLLSELIFNGNSQFFTPIFRSKYPDEAGILHHLTLQLLPRLRYYCSQHSVLRYHWPLISSLLWGDMTNQSSRQSRATWLEKYEKSYWSWSSSKIYAWFGLNLAPGIILSLLSAAASLLPKSFSYDAKLHCQGQCRTAFWNFWVWYQERIETRSVGKPTLQSMLLCQQSCKNNSWNCLSHMRLLA